MAWDFCTDPDVQARLDWADRFVAEEIEPVESLFIDVVDVGRPVGSISELIEQWRHEVKDHQLYAAHLPPEQGGQGFGEVNLALLNEVIGRSYWAPYVFATGPGTPGSGQSDVLAVFGTDEQKQRWLYPLLEGKVTMIYSMTEPHGGADPTGFRCRAVRDGDEWVINGDKFFSSGAEQADLILLMAVTDPDAGAYQGMSMFIVPADAHGVRIFGDLGGLGREGGVGFGREGSVGFGRHPYIRYQDVRVPADHLIGPRGKAFEIAQRRLSAGRMHHAMRAVALAKREFDMICERALSRYTQGGLLAEKQMVQEMVADAWLELTQFRLLILQAAWIIERDGYGAARRHVAACKVKAAEIQRQMAFKATHIHGALGTTNTLPITRGTDWLGIADGPTEVHKVTLARQVLRDYTPSGDLWPTRFRPRTLLKARERLDEIVATRLPDAARSELHELLQRSSNGNDEAIARMAEFMHLTTEEGLYADFDPAARLFPALRR
jgi:acyl-CoA dehydrogenase